jgi:hypothetical protein
MKEQTERAVNLSRPGEIIDFVSLARVLWHWRVFFVSGFILLTVIGALLVFLAANKFRSEAVFQVGILAKNKQDINLVEKTGMPIPFFKEGEKLIHNLDHMQALMALDQTIERGVMKKFFKAHKKNQEIRKYFELLYNFSKIVQLPQDEGTAVIGFKLFYEAETPNVAQKIVNFFGNYIRGSYLAIDLSKYIRENIEYHNRSIRECENKEIERNIVLERLNNKREKLQLLAKRFPIVGNVDNQLLSKSKNASIYYLSPNIQLMGIESMIVVSNNEIERLAWQKELSIISLKFFSQANRLLASDGENGIALLAKVNILKKEIFAEENVKSMAVRYVDNSLSNDLQRFQDIYYGVFKFISGPVISPDKADSDMILQVIGVMIFNLIFLLLVILLIHWGKRNWQEIRESRGQVSRIRKSGC